VIIKLLEGKNINLRIAEKDDVLLIMRWWSDTQYMGEYQDVMNKTQPELEKIMLENTIFFIIEKKDGVKIGHITGWMIGRTMEIGFALIPSERGKGYGTEAIQLMVDHLFLTKDIVRIQVTTDVKNVASQRALEKAGFVREGTMRKYFYAKGNYRDHFLYSILREEWKEPKILTKKTSQIKKHTGSHNLEKK
jgi:RimJ/RimL family protein N-acetyltransferase